jgi:hypothetical protein
VIPKGSRKRRGRGRGVDATGRSIGPSRFLQLPHYLLKSQAWQSLDATARALFIEVAQRYNGYNNGEIGLGVREAGVSMHVRPQTAGRAFGTLVATGFLRVGRDSAFNVKARLAREWIVTLFPHRDQLASHDFMRWRPSVDQSKEQVRNRTRSVANEDTLSNNQTALGAASSHCDHQTSMDVSGLNRITSISHQGGRRGSEPVAELCKRAAPRSQARLRNCGQRKIGNEMSGQVRG